MGYLVRNTARTTLSAGVLAGAGLLPVVNPAAFPAPTTAGLTGTVTTSGHTVTGVATLFQTELNRGDTVWANVGGQVELRYVVYIISEVLMVVDRAFSANLAGAPLYSGVPVLLTLVEGIAYKEHVACYGVSGTDLQVIRAQDQSAAAAFSAGAVVELRVTKGLLEDLPDRAVWDVFALLADAALSSVITVSVPGVVATDLSGALQEIFDALAAHIADVLGAHAAEAISFASGGWAAGNVKDAILEAFADAITALNAHAGASPAHDATQIEFSPYGPITATDVQGALVAIADIAISSGAEKIRDAVETAGLVWNAADDTQLSRAIGAYVHFANYYVDSGGANTKVLTSIGTFRVPGAYSNGMQVCFRVNTTNTGATTIDVDGMGAVNIVRSDGTALQKWDLVAGEEVTVVYEAALGAFVRSGVWSGQVLYSGLYTDYQEENDGTFFISGSISHTVQYPGATLQATVSALHLLQGASGGTGSILGVSGQLTFNGDTIEVGVEGNGAPLATMSHLAAKIVAVAAGTYTVNAHTEMLISPTITAMQKSVRITGQFVEVRP